MKKCSVRLVLVLLTAVMLTSTAMANSAPVDHRLVIKVKNAPEGMYYLDILESIDPEQNAIYRSTIYDDPTPYTAEASAADSQLLDALRAAAPEGWRSCTARGTGYSGVWADIAGTGGTHIIHGTLPREYRIVLVTQSGESWVSDPLKREALSSSASVDWAVKTARTPPVWLAYGLQFLSTFLPTLLLEGIMLIVFRYEWKRNWKPFLLINLVTQGILTALFSVQIVRSGIHPAYLLILIPMEIIIALTEGWLYTDFLHGHSKRRAFLYGVTANTVSCLTGFGLVWFTHTVLASLLE